MSGTDARTNSLMRKLLSVYLPLVGISVLVLFSVIEIRSYTLKIRELKHNLNDTVHLQSPAFTLAVWEYNNQQLEILLDDLRLIPHFHGAVVQDSFGEVLASTGSVDDADPELRVEAELVYETEHVRETIGRLILTYHRDQIYSQLRQRLLADSIVLLVLILTLIGVTFLATRRYIVKPISQLREKVLRIADGTGYEQLEDIRTGDEIEELAGAFLTMQQKVVDRESALEGARETTLNELLESAPDAMIVVDNVGNICRCNKRASDLFGYDHQELIGKNVTMLMPDRFRDRHGTHMTSYFENPQARDMGTGLELSGSRRDGTEFPIEIGLSPFNDPLGMMAVAAIRDISERKKNEIELRKLNQAVEQGSAIVFMTDTKGVIEYVNPRFTDVTGYTAKEVIGQNPRLLNSGTQEPSLYKELWESLQDGREWRGEFCNRMKNGSLFWASAAIAPIRDSKGVTTHFVAIEEDITQRKELEGEIQTAREQAEAANRAKSEFLSHMSHELRTPLNGVLGYAQILQRDMNATAKQKQSLEAIVNCGEHLLSLINDVLDLSKIEAGRLEVDEAPCDLSKLIKSVEHVVAQRARTKTLSFETEVSPEVPHAIMTDEAKLRQILVNLLGNAVKFTAEGGVALRIAESPKGRLCIEVEDTGVGMDKSELNDIFDPFKQVEAGKAAGGTGLGLAITRRLIERLGGGIDVKSEKGKGSTFTVDLPLVEAGTQDMGSLEEEFGKRFDSAVLAPGQVCTVLVADDRHTNRDILEQMLTAMGITPVITDDGDTAIEALRSDQHIDLVLMDVRMPRMNGIEAVKLIRADKQLMDHKVIAVTASVFPEFRDKAIQAGFDDFLGKPFRTEELVQKIESHLGHRFVREQVTADVESNHESEEQLPDTLRKTMADRIQDAVRLGNITALNTLVTELESHEGAASYAQRIGELTRAFDFAGLQHLANQLEQPAREE